MLVCVVGFVYAYKSRSCVGSPVFFLILYLYQAIFFHLSLSGCLWREKKRLQTSLTHVCPLPPSSNWAASLSACLPAGSFGSCGGRQAGAWVTARIHGDGSL